MFIARINGALTSTVKHDSLKGIRLLIGQRMGSDAKPVGDPIVVVDWIGAATNETVIVTADGDLARCKLGNTTPVQLVVVGIVDEIHSPTLGQGASL